MGDADHGLRALLYPNLQGKTFSTAVAGSLGLGDLKKSASDPPEKRQKKCLLETRTKIGLTDKNSGTNGQFLFRLGNFFVRLGPLFCPLSHFFAAFLVASIWQKSGNFFSGALGPFDF